MSRNLLKELHNEIDDGQRQPADNSETANIMNQVQPETGFGLLHLAILDNDIDKLKAAIAFGAPFFPDAQGRWPSTLAVLLERSDEICDYVGDEEAKFLGLTV